MSPPGRIASPHTSKVSAEVTKTGAPATQLVAQAIMSGEVFWQSGATGCLDGQSDMLPAMAGMASLPIAFAAADTENGERTSPAIMRAGKR